MPKRLTKVIFLLPIMLFAAQDFLYAQFTSYSNDFLNISTNAQAAALGNSYIAQAKPAHAALWNPANLVSDSTKYQFAITHQNLFGQEASLDFFSSTYYKNTTGFSISALRVGVNNIQNTLNIKDSLGNFDFNRIEYFNTADYALFLGIARKSLKNNFSWGITTKLIFRHIGTFAHAIGFGIDAGINHQINNWKFAISLKDASGTYSFWKINENNWPQDVLDSIIPPDFQMLEIAPQKLIIGVFKNFILPSNFEISSEINFEAAFFNQQNTIISSPTISILPKIGIEGNYKHIFFLRMGLNDFQEFETIDKNKIYTQKLNLGFGFKVKSIQIDYAISNIANSNLLASSHLFSLYLSTENLTKGL